MGGVFIRLNNNLFLFWKIGRLVFVGRSFFDNSVFKYSNFCSYYFGNSEIFSIDNVHYMEKFYKAFPVFLNRFTELSFEHYKLIVDVSDLEKRYFYFWLAIFCRSSVSQLRSIISNDLYNFI